MPLIRRIYSGWARSHPFDLAHRIDTSGFVPASECAAGDVPAAQITFYGGSQPSIVRTVLDPGRKPIEIEVGDATTVPPPADRVVYFMYNPFSRALVKALLENVESHLQGRLEHAFFVCYNPVHADVLDQSPRFARWSAQTTRYAADELGYGPDIEDTTVVWQSLPARYRPQATANRQVAVSRSQWCRLV